MRRKRQDMSISVHPDLSVTVVAPENKPIQQVEAKVLSRAAWILRQQLRFRDLHPLPTPKRYVSGESHRYLGRQYRLRVSGNGEQERVLLRRPFLVVELRSRTGSDAVRRAIEKWLRLRAEEILPREVERFWARHASLRHLAVELRIRQMKTRWGSCSTSGVITLNPLLVHAALPCIEYVIAHEVCHRMVMNHGPRFTRLLDRLLPDWQARRRKLNCCLD